MPEPGLADPANTVSLVAAIADYAASFTVTDEAGLETARRCLIAALVCCLDALRDPQCAALIGPIVPGAVMPGGARVPGTSLELEPTQAAFCLGLMLYRPAESEDRLRADHQRPAESLAALLAAADYQARRAVMEGKPPSKVRDLLAAMLKALAIQGALDVLEDEHYGPSNERIRPARVAASAIVAAQLGGTRAQIIRAISYSCLDSGICVQAEERDAIGSRQWVIADAMGRAVRHACQATPPGQPRPLTSAEIKLTDQADRLLGAIPASTGKPFGARHLDQLAGRRQLQEAAPLTAAFQAAVDRHFPPRQAERVIALCAAPWRLDELPVNELIAALVTNGARQR
jgi:2-methylcitrate dehydratase